MAEALDWEQTLAARVEVREGGECSGCPFRRSRRPREKERARGSLVISFGEWE